MIAFLRGNLIHIDPVSVLIDVNGVGYRVHIPASLFGELPSIGKPFTVHTTLVIRENSQTLYGFSSQDQVNLFETLIAIRGIGPKLALSIIGHMSGAQLYTCVAQEDTDILSRIPGIGKKTATRLIVELTDKLSAFMESHGPTNSKVKRQNTHAKDAISALINLGYTQMLAQQAIERCLQELGEKEVDLPLLITRSLNYVK